MARIDSLWIDIDGGLKRGEGNTVVGTVRLAKCRNCGNVKVLSNPCSLDHLAALREFGSRLGPAA